MVSGWNYDLGAEFGHNDFDYNIDNTLNASLGPCLDVACAPGPDGILGTADDPGIPNQTEFFAGRLLREEFDRRRQRGPAGGDRTAGAGQPRLRRRLPAGELRDPRGRAGLLRQRLPPRPGQRGRRARAGSSVFPGFTPDDATERDRTNFGLYADAETDLTPKLLANVAARFESYSDFGERLSGKVALRYQPSRRVMFRAAPRAPASGRRG